MDPYLVTLLIPEPANQEVWALKQEVHRLTGSRNALRLPPHITLIPPLRQPAPFEPAARQLLHNFAAHQPGCTAVLRNFAWFGGRTLYLPVTQTDGVQALYAALYQHCRQHLPAVPVPTRPFVPHVTLATRDLPAAQVPALQALFAERSYAAHLELTELALFRHDGRAWQLLQKFGLVAS
ncbi:2'-5' RNA ligase family protein [Hymenobacter metallilatus]|uniref:2'-5' RNA ligase family protein n=1 Tax=Hymenobacter metallilatus TaxID=2493666 RepID=A0A428IY77_9BACT|nr:2'-5' RNA ligase family protein [Hymenobacter metallilatus]RSK24071.1 2'-5' RNA ligase family protein [Hymenobacter metallilatus]